MSETNGEQLSPLVAFEQKVLANASVAKLMRELAAWWVGLPRGR